MKNTRIESLRFIFALFVVLHHCQLQPGISLFEAGGPCAVVFFFMLSGFLLAQSHTKKKYSQEKTYWQYCKTRILRIYPLHIICLLLFILIHYTSTGQEIYGKTFILNIMLLQSWIPIQGIYFSYNAVSWFLSDIIFLYAIFPLLFKVCYSPLNGTRLSVILGIFISYGLLLTLIPERYTHAIIYINPMLRTPEFMLGILLYRATKSQNTLIYNVLHSNKKKGGYISISTLIIACIAYTYLPEQIAYSSLFWIPCMTLISFAYTSMSKSIVSKILSTKFVSTLGAISFPLFLSHFLTFEILSNTFISTYDSVVRIPTYIIFSISIAAVLTIFVERPMNKLIKQHLT